MVLLLGSWGRPLENTLARATAERRIGAELEVLTAGRAAWWSGPPDLT
jgi:hypothetical protein